MSLGMGSGVEGSGHASDGDSPLAIRESGSQCRIRGDWARRIQSQ